jgi:hypothetical protein
MLNRNSKKLPKEDILSIKKTGKRLRNGYALTKLKRWKKEYAERKLRSTTKAEEPKKTYAMNTERLKRAKQTIARRKRSKSMEERRQYWMKKNKNVESVGSKRKSTSRSTKKKVVTRERAMPTKQDISKAKSGVKKNRSVESVDRKVKSTSKKEVTRERAMPTKQAISKAKSGVKKNKSVESVDRKVKSTSKSTQKKEVTRERAMPTKNRAMVNKQIVEKIKSVEQKTPVVELPIETPVVELSIETPVVELPIETPVVELPIETPSELTTIKEIAKESKGKIVVASLPKFTKEKIKKVVKEVKSESQNVGYNIIENIVSGKNNIGEIEIKKFYVWLEQKAEIKLQDIYQFNNLYGMSLYDLIKEYQKDTSAYIPDKEKIKIYLLILLCWYMYKDIIQSPYNIKSIINKINRKMNFEDWPITIPIYIISKENKIKEIENLTWNTYISLANYISKADKKVQQGWFSDVVYFDKEDIVSMSTHKLLIMSKDWFNNETKNKLKPNTIYQKDFKDITDQIGYKYPAYETVLPDENDYVSHECIVEDEIQKCKLTLLSNKFFNYEYHDRIKISPTLTKFAFVTYKSVTYNAQYMLDIMQIFKRLGITKFNFKYNNKKSVETSTIITQTKGAFIVEAVNPKHFIYCLLSPTYRDNIENLDINFSNKIVEKYYNNYYLNDDIDMLSEVKEIANDVPAFGDLFSDIDYSSEVQEIANDVPAFGDHITEEKIELDTEYDLPDVLITRDDSKIASSKDIRAMKFKQIMLPSKYKALLGKVPENFRLLLWGAPGHGKSSLALTIANDIGKRVKTLYVSAEESLESATLSSRIKRFKATSRNLMFNDTNNPEIIEKIIMTFNPKFIVIDSVNVILGKTESIINLMLKYPNIGFIIIAQATKDRKRYAGLGSLAHAVDIVVNVKDGIATAEKNRYAQLGSMVVKGIKI